MKKHLDQTPVSSKCYKCWEFMNKNYEKTEYYPRAEKIYNDYLIGEKPTLVADKCWGCQSRNTIIVLTLLRFLCKLEVLEEPPVDDQPAPVVVISNIPMP